MYSVAPLLGGVELLHGSYRSHRFTPHAQDTAVIGVVRHGRAVVSGAGQTLELRPGSVLVIPPMVLHDAFTTGPDEWQYQALYLTTRQIHAVSHDLAEGAGVLGTRPFVLHNGEAAEHVLALHQSLRSSSGSEHHALTEQLRVLLQSLAIEQIASDAPDESLRLSSSVARVRREMDEHPLVRRNLSDMARLARVSRFTFAHAFSRAYGVSPHAYALQRRIAVVRDLLAAGELVSRAAHHVGFADQSHLTRRFVAVVGVTPGEFRRAWQRAPQPAVSDTRQVLLGR